LRPPAAIWPVRSPGAILQRAVSRKYPLETLRRARADEVDKRTHAYGEAIGREERARAELGRKQAEREAIVSRIEAQTQKEHDRLARGELRASDLARGAAFGVRAEIEKAIARHDEDLARARHEGDRAEASAKRAALGRASADAQVVERNRAAWERGREKIAARADEIAAEEAHAARMHRKGGR
jgi:hypothetical protein